MTAMNDFDRLIANWLDTAGPSDIRPEAVDTAVATARGTVMRSGLRATLTGPAPWPSRHRAGFRSLPAGIRLAIAVVFVAGLLPGALYVGGRVIEAINLRNANQVEAIQRYEGQVTRLSRGLELTSPTALSDSSVLGFDDRGYIVWDVATDSAVGQGRLNARRSQPTAVLLVDGRVLVLGGDLSEPDEQGSSVISSATAEVWDPRTGTSSQPIPLTPSRWIFAAIRLADGRVLVSGGVTTDGSEDFLAAAEIFDPTTGAFSPTGPMTEPRIGHSMTLIGDGRVLVVGGNTGAFPGEPSSTTEIYDPLTGTFSPGGALPDIVPNPDDTRYPLAWRSPVVTLIGGEVLVPGLRCQEVHAYRADGLSDGVRPTPIEVFDAATGTFRAGGSMPHCVQEAVPLPNGQLYVRGWWYKAPPDEFSYDVSLPWAGIYDPRTGAVNDVPPPTSHGSSIQTVVLPDGRVVLLGSVTEVME